mmetsp:Transcript_37442/g.80847  ORF Transcript_37442/g.80847 Transcript_37442/m.80847 type:complete len:204 (+) Transcript_37442:424-1035(+)
MPCPAWVEGRVSAGEAKGERGVAPSAGPHRGGDRGAGVARGQDGTGAPGLLRREPLRSRGPLFLSKVRRGRGGPQEGRRRRGRGGLVRFVQGHARKPPGEALARGLPRLGRRGPLIRQVQEGHRLCRQRRLRPHLRHLPLLPRAAQGRNLGRPGGQREARHQRRHGGRAAGALHAHRGRAASAGPTAPAVGRVGKVKGGQLRK